MITQIFTIPLTRKKKKRKRVKRRAKRLSLDSNLYHPLPTASSNSTSLKGILMLLLKLLLCLQGVDMD